MEKGNISPAPVNRAPHSFRVLRPLIWWLILVLVLYGIRTHQKWMERTRLTFTVSLGEKSLGYMASATLDGKPISSGEHIVLGSHTFTITHPKANTFSTNLFTWYGGHDLGRVELSRAKGTLVIHSSPRAAGITILGPEFRRSFTNSDGGTFDVPTDQYDIKARFAFSEHSDVASVSANSISTVRIAPQLGMVQILSSHSNTTFRLTGKGNRVGVSGELPVLIGELPVGEYEVRAERSGESKTKTLWIKSEQTNEVLIKFEYGAVALETHPEGARVLDGAGRLLGTTPFTRDELRAGKWPFTLERDEYETAVITLDVTASQTNRFETNLVSRRYTAAMRDARNHFESERFDEAVEALSEALKYKPDDSAAASLRREATGFSHLARSRTSGRQGNFVVAITELHTALVSIPGNTEAKRLLADYTERKRQIDEAEARRLAQERAAEERRANIAAVKACFDTTTRRYDGAALFVDHEITTTNSAKIMGDAIRDAMQNEPPPFEVSRYNWQGDQFIIEAKQKVSDGSRQCVIVGGQVSTNECLVCFKVIEYQTAHQVSLLGGLLEAKVTTEADRNGERAARFQEQAKEGVKIIGLRLQRVTTR